VVLARTSLDLSQPARLQSKRKPLGVALLAALAVATAAPAFADGGATQATATVITALPFNDVGTTVGKVDDYKLPPDTTAPTLTANCATIANGAGPAGSLPRGAVYAGTGVGADGVYRMGFTAGNADTLTITMTPTGGQDLALVVYCNTASNLLSDGLVVDDTGGPNAAESVTVGGITPGTQLIVVVDGYSSTGAPGPSGPYTLSVTSTGAVQPDPAGVAAISINNATVTEGNAGTTNMNFAVSVSPVQPVPVTVQATTGFGSATAGDFTTFANQLVTIPANTASATVSVQVAGDNVVEPNETMTVTIANPSTGAIITSQGLGTINNDDSAVLSLAAANIVEGNAGNTVTNLTASLSNPVQGPVAVQFNSVDGTATVGANDYLAANGVLNFASGVTSQTFPFTVRGDLMLEANEALSIQLGGLVLPPSVTAVTATAVNPVTIQNDDSATLTLSSPSILEGNSGTTPMVFNASLNNPVQGGFSLNFASADGNNLNPLTNATLADLDYNAASGTLTLAEGTQTGTLTVQVRGDNEVEPDQNLRMLLSNLVLGPGIAPAGFTFPATTVGTIRNDDMTMVTITSADIVEGNSGTRTVTLNLAINNPAKEPVTVQYATQNDTAVAPGDYVAANGTITFPPGNQAQTLTLTINSNTVLEADETFRVVLSNPSANASLGTPSVGTVRILNDDSVTVRLDNAQIMEGDQGTTRPLLFPISISAAADIPVSVNFATSDIRAMAGSDYVATSGVLTFAPGEVNKTIPVTINGDAQVELDEDFNLTISNPQPVPPAVTIERAVAVGMILADDFVPVPTLSREGLALLLAAFGLLGAFASRRRD
jgi:hypothetical protein